MDLVSLNDSFLNSDAIDSNTSVMSASFVEDVVSQNYQRFIISGIVMSALSKFMYSDDMNLTILKGLFMGASTLLSDVLLGVAIKNNYIDNSSTGNYKLALGQTLLESVLYFPIATVATGEKIQFVPNFMGQAYRQALISSATSQAVQMAMTPAPSASS